MQHFSIRDIENLTGIKAHTLRIWEQRYPMFAPKHQQPKHRAYNNDDLKRLLRVAFLYHSGMRISQIATLSEEAMVQQIEATEADLSNYSLYINTLLEATVDFDERKFSQQFNELIDLLGFEKCIAELAYPLLNRIGLLWMTNHVIPAQEHFASYLIQNKIIARIDALAAPSAQLPAIVLFTPNGEHHELPLLFIYYLLKKYGWNTIYLGSNISVPILQQFKPATEVASFYTHIITNFTGITVDDYFETLCRTFPGKKIAASGAAIQNLQRSFVPVTALTTDDAIYRFIRRNPYLGNT